MSHVEPKHETFSHIGWLTAAPTTWAVHFSASYLTAAIWCAKFADSGGGATEVSLAIAVYTLIALVIISFIGFAGYRRHRRGQSPPPHDAGHLSDHRRFIGYATFLLAMLSAVATIFTALVAVFVRSCD